ncbi:MAG: hypothetical protein ACTSQG_12310 [Promethearchaeota archaeon]
MKHLHCQVLIIFQIRVAKNTSFLREAFSDFIKENNGTPLCIVLDYRIDFGLPKNLDPDHLKLLKTFIIASTILREKTDLKYNMMNLVLIGTPKDLKHLELFKNQPHLVYKLVRTNNEHVNKLIEQSLNNPERVKKILTIDYILIDETNDTISAAKRLGVILDRLLQKRQSLINEEKTKVQTKLITGDYDPAKILYKISDARVYIDGKIYNVENNPKFTKYKENIIYVLGYYVQSTVNKVNAKLEKFILEDFPKIRKVTTDTEINISLNSFTIIDGSVTPSLNLLLSTKLKGFKNINLLTSPVNFNKMENSPGFISLRNYIIKRL